MRVSMEMVVTMQHSFGALGAEVLRAAAAAEGRPGAPLHIVAVWLAALLWLEDARWRKLRSGGAPTDGLEVSSPLLICVHPLHISWPQCMTSRCWEGQCMTSHCWEGAHAGYVWTHPWHKETGPSDFLYPRS